MKDTKKQLELIVKRKLSELLSPMSHEVTNKQKQISRILPPYIQLKLDDVYTAAASQKGKGSTVNTKRCTREGIDGLRHTMFDEATGKLLGELDSLQVPSVDTKAIQPCKKPSFGVDIAKPLKVWGYEVIFSACDEVREIYADDNLENTEEVQHTVEISSQSSHIPGAPEEHFSKRISRFFKHILEDQITVQRGRPQNDAKTKSAKDQETISRWECSIQNTLRNGSSEEILKVLSTCPNAETSEVLLPFVHESEIHRTIMMPVAELFQN